jgi:hypothetical protein
MVPQVAVVCSRHAWGVNTSLVFDLPSVLPFVQRHCLGLHETDGDTKMFHGFEPRKNSQKGK